MKNLIRRRFIEKNKINIVFMLILCIFGVLLGTFIKIGFADDITSKYTLETGQNFNRLLKLVTNCYEDIDLFAIKYSTKDEKLLNLVFDVYTDEKYGPSGSVAYFSWDYNDLDKGLSVDVSGDGNIKIFCNYETQTAYVLVKGNDKIYLNSDSSYLLFNFSKLVNINFNNVVETSNVTNMSEMFADCLALTKLDLSSFNTRKVINMSGMFEWSPYLIKVNLSNFDTSNVINMFGMFNKCDSITNLDLSNFDTRNVTDMARMFYKCFNLKGVNLSSFNTSNVTDMSYMFNSCSNLKELNLSNFETSKVTSFMGIFQGCSLLESLDISNFDISNSTNIWAMFYGCSNLTILDLSSFNTYNTDDISSLFYNCEKLETIFVSEFNSENNKGWNIKSYSDHSNMFKGCTQLKGGYGTSFSDLGVTNKTYAVIDSPTQQGYLTKKVEYSNDLNASYTLSSNDNLVINFKPVVRYVTNAYLTKGDGKVELVENNQYSIVDGKFVLNSNFLNTLEDGRYQLHIQNKDSVDENIIDIDIIKEYKIVIKKDNTIETDKSDVITISKGHEENIKVDVKLGYEISSVTINGEEKEISGDIINITPVEDSEIVIKTLPIQYQLVEGNNQTHNIKEEKDIIVKSDGPLEIFKSLEVCEKDKCSELELNKDYTVRKGSTIITFTNKYLDKLKTGDYLFKINYENETSVEGNFKISKISVNSNGVNTGDKFTKYILLFIISFVSFIFLTILLFMKNKNEEELEII